MEKNKCKIKSGTMGYVLSDYLAKEPDKEEICPMVIILLDYYTDDDSEKYMTVKEFLQNAYRKRSMLQALIEKWRKN